MLRERAAPRPPACCPIRSGGSRRQRGGRADHQEHGRRSAYRIPLAGGCRALRDRHSGPDGRAVNRARGSAPGNCASAAISSSSNTPTAIARPRLISTIKRFPPPPGLPCHIHSRGGGTERRSSPGVRAVSRPTCKPGWRNWSNWVCRANRPQGEFYSPYQYSGRGRSRSESGQRLQYIPDQIVRILDPDRKPHQPRGDPQRRALLF
jgi:hypothetical protein